MQKIFHTIILIFVFSSLFSQAKSVRRFEIKTNLLNLAAVGPSAGLEYNLKDNSSIMFSLASGHIDYGDFGGVTKYKTATVEYRKYFLDNVLFFGPYIKNIMKEVEWRQYIVAGVIPIGRNRGFVGNGFSAGVTTGIKIHLSKTIVMELNNQLGYGHYYTMTDKYNNFSSGNYFDTRIGLWFGFRL